MFWPINKFNKKPVYNIDGIPTIIENVKGNIASGYILNNNFTLTPTYVAKVDNYFAHGETIHKAVEDATAKMLSNRPVEEKIDDFIKEFPTLQSTSTGKVFYDWHNILTGSCVQGRNSFCNEHGVDLEKTYTVEYFLNLVKDAYGGDNITKLMERYNNM